MIKLLLIVLIFSVNAWSKVSLELEFNGSSIKQGEIAVGRLVVKEIDGQSVLAGLKGKNLGKTIYIMNVEPFMGKDGHLESQVKFIFLAIPQATAISENINGEEVLISWNNIEVTPTEQPKSFLLGDFEIPARKKIIQWVLICFGVLLIFGLFSYFRKVYLSKNARKMKLNRIRKELMDCTSYDDIVLVWSQKQRYLTAFPDLDSKFKILESILFKYQFKQYRSEAEILEVTSAYAQFKNGLPEVLNAN